MQKNGQNWNRRLILVKVFLIGAFFSMSFIIGYGGVYAQTKQGQCSVQHIAIMRALKKQIESGKPIPRNLSELAALEYSKGLNLSWILSLPKLRYYPDAWNKPGRILLQSKVCGSYVVTFGDCVLAVMSQWYFRSEGKQPDVDKLSEEERNLPMKGCLHALPIVVFLFLLMLSLVMVVIVERLIKPKTSSP
jgi:hypothetical protein